MSRILQHLNTPAREAELQLRLWITSCSKRIIYMATRLHMKDAVMLSETLAEEKGADETLTAIADRLFVRHNLIVRTRLVK
ncbi:Unknown protein sequence [Pseudomonas syringae pv. spinaceae]|uniref:Uncharacterized protein n=2 Tax=Pseudomonas syringae group TaxID=136849 RepID=A0A0Q0C542_PSESX|nr:Unknown protein sequence [Pseudomonas syringae pv. spinaceae]